ncbi:Heme chaperone HemW (Oxygen-independent coproporphyrinogen-III oxidase-like protein sll1917), partial [Durusdinium trenchii]
VGAVTARVRRSAAPRAVSSAYVHIPFCRQQCRYCDFPIDVAGARFSERSRRYVDCIIKEIQVGGAGEWVPFECSPLRTLYFGGGTPSLLPLEDFRRLFEALAQRFGFAPQCEITVEMDPGTFSGEKAAALAELGVTRASVGVQSLDDEQLQRCGRKHTAQEAKEAIRAC